MYKTAYPEFYNVIMTMPLNRMTTRNRKLFPYTVNRMLNSCLAVYNTCSRPILGNMLYFLDTL